MIVATHAAKLGSPGYHCATVPHPVYGKNEAELRSLAASLADKVLAQVCPA
jgi:hypothetical protein